jgi:hypothetical protein
VLDTETRDVGAPDERKCGDDGSGIVHLDKEILPTEDVLCGTMNRSTVKRVYRQCMKNTEIVITVL